MTRFVRTATVLALILVAAAHAKALDASLDFQLGNFDFAADRPSTATTFDGSSYTWGIDAKISQRVADGLTASLSYDMDPVLRKTVYAGIKYASTYFVLSGGPLFGLFNTSSTLLKTGLRATITAQLPGIAFISLDSGSTIGAQLVRTGDYSESLSEIVAGVYVANAICSLHLSQRSFVEKTSAGPVDTNFTEYFFQTDAFQKNVPYSVRLKFGYQLQSKYYDYTTPVTQTVGSLVAAANVSARLTDILSLNVGLESNIYTFGLDALSGLSVTNVFLFRAHTGVSLTLDQKKQESKQK